MISINTETKPFQGIPHWCSLNLDLITLLFTLFIIHHFQESEPLLQLQVFMAFLSLNNFTQNILSERAKTGGIDAPKRSLAPKDIITLMGNHCN